MTDDSLRSSHRTYREELAAIYSDKIMLASIGTAIGIGYFNFAAGLVFLAVYSLYYLGTEKHHE